MGFHYGVILESYIHRPLLYHKIICTSTSAIHAYHFPDSRRTIYAYPSKIYRTHVYSKLAFTCKSSFGQAFTRASRIIQCRHNCHIASFRCSSRFLCIAEGSAEADVYIVDVIGVSVGVIAATRAHWALGTTRRANGINHWQMSQLPAAGQWAHMLAPWCIRDSDRAQQERWIGRRGRGRVQPVGWSGRLR